MPARAIVVLSQTARPSPDRREREEELVASLLMEDGLEVTVIPDLSQLGSDSTGLLCLEGIKGDMILASWYPPEEAFQRLAEHRIVGRFGKTMHDAREVVDSQPPSAPSAPGVYDAMRRRIFCLNLDLALTTSALREEIGRIAEETSIQ